MDIQILSYNGTGFNIENGNFLKFLINSMKIDFFVLQEHMHLKANLYKIENEFHDFESFLLYERVGPLVDWVYFGGNL